MPPTPSYINANQATNPAPSPKGLTVPSPGKTPSPIITSQSSSLTPPASATALRNNLDRILRDLSPSPSTSSTAQTLSSPLPPSRMENMELIVHNGLVVKGSSEDGREDELCYGEEQFDYGDEASDGYEDEDKSMTSSDEDDANFEAKGRGQKDGNEDHNNGKSKNSEEATAKTSNPGFSNVYVHHQPADIRKRENEGSQDDVMEKVLNASYMTGRTAFNYYSSGLQGVGLGVIPSNEQTRRDIFRALINKELTQDWEQQQQRFPQAAAEEDRYDSDAKSEWLLEGESTESEKKELSVRANNDNDEGRDLRHTTSAIQDTLVPRSSKENVLLKLPSRCLRSISSTGALANIAQEAFLDDLDPDEQAELKELEKYREDDLAPLDGTFADDKEQESIVELGTPVKDAYRLYLRERSQGSSGEDESGDVKIKEDEDQETDTTVAIFTTLSSLPGMKRGPFSKMTACDIVRDSDCNCQLEFTKSHLDIAQQQPPQRDHSGFMLFLGLGLVITVCVQLAWSVIR